MAKEKFIDHKFSASSMALIDTANGILNEYEKKEQADKVAEQRTAKREEKQSKKKGRRK